MNNNQKESDNLYDLKEKEVDKLVESLKNPDSVEDIKIEGKNNPYKIDKLARVPTIVKALIIKFFTAGAICYFFLWGLGLVITNMLDLVVFTGVCIGIITDLLVNTAFLYFETEKKEYHKYMLLPVSCKKMWTLLINIPFGIVEMLSVFFIYSGINLAIAKAKGLGEGAISLGVEPLLFGLLFVIIDMTFIMIKNLLVSIVKDAINKSK